MSAVASFPDAAERARDEQMLTVLALWDDGWSAGQITTQVPWTRSAVIAAIWRIQRACPDALARQAAMGRVSTRDWRAIFADALQRGLSAAAVAREQGVSPVSVYKARVRHGVTLPFAGHPRRWPDAAAKLAAAAREGLSQAETAVRHGVSETCVKTYRRKLGIELVNGYAKRRRRRLAEAQAAAQEAAR